MECVPGPEEAGRLLPSETRDYAFLGDPEEVAKAAAAVAAQGKAK